MARGPANPRSFAIGAALLALPAAAQNQLWIDQLGTSGEDRLSAVAPDGSGGLFAIGHTDGALAGSGAGGRDAVLARYDGAGNVEWIRQIGSAGYDAGRAAAPDGSGGVFASGETDGSFGGPSAGWSDAWIARCDAAGRVSWVRQLGSAAAEYTYASAPDGAGGAYVAGTTFGDLGGPSAGDADAWIARFDAQGNLSWTRQLGTAGAEAVRAAASDGEGGVYVSGQTAGALGGPNGGLDDAWLARIDGSGALLWLRQIGSELGDAAWAAAPASAGGVFLAGHTGGSLGAPSAGSWDVWLAHYDRWGSQQWLRQLGGENYEVARAAAPDGVGGLYLIGGTDGAFGGAHAGLEDTWVAHFDAAGQGFQMDQLGTGFIDFGLGAAPDGAGGLYVCGATMGSLGAPAAGGWDGWLARFDPCAAEPYCVGAINSTGQGASIGFQGSTSIAQNDLVLTVASCPPNQVGIFFFGSFQTQSPFGNGWLCATGGQMRLLPAVQVNAAGAGSFAVDFGDPISAASSIQPGASKHFQFWYRDPLPPGGGYNLSNALAAFICP